MHDLHGSIDLQLMCVGPLVLVFAGTLVSGLTFKRPVTGSFEVGTSYFSGIAAVPLAVTSVWWLWLWHRRRGLHGTDVCLRGDPESRHLKLTLLSCIAGVVVGVAVRLALGRVDVTTFCNGSAPLIAGLLIGIVFEGSRPTARGALRPQHPAVFRQRHLGVVYILAGAVCTALGNIPGQGSIYRALFLVVCGSIGASCYVVMGIVLHNVGSEAPDS